MRSGGRAVRRATAPEATTLGHATGCSERAGAAVGSSHGRNVAAPALHAAPVLAGGGGLYASTLSFLVGQAVLEQEEQEERVMKEEARRRQEERLGAQVAEEWVELVDERTGKTFFWNTSTTAAPWTRPSASSSSLPGRKRKKKRRRRRTTKWTS